MRDWSLFETAGDSVSDCSGLGRKATADKAMKAVSSFFKMTGRVGGVFVTPVPVSVPGGHASIMTAPLLNSSGADVGEVRVLVYSPSDVALPVRVRVEWTRKAFGFWYRNEFFMQVEEQSQEIVRKLRGAMFFVKTTADGSVRVASMNRGFRKIKKSPTRDKAARVGMMMG